MAKDPAFLFYPGDYLRDTQCLSEKTQVAYDRIMCEHMRNICITQEQLNFFIKRLSEEEKKEIFLLLKKIKGGYCIDWVAESICKRMAYSESRRKNKEGKTKNISKSYVNHMENEIVNENETEIIKGVQGENELTIGEVNTTIEYVDRTKQVKLSENEIINFWEAFKLNQAEPAYLSRSKKIKHFRDWLKNQHNGQKSFTNSSQPKLGTSAARIEALRNW